MQHIYQIVSFKHQSVRVLIIEGHPAAQDNELINTFKEDRTMSDTKRIRSEQLLENVTGGIVVLSDVFFLPNETVDDKNGDSMFKSYSILSCIDYAEQHGQSSEVITVNEYRSRFGKNI